MKNIVLSAAMAVFGVSQGVAQEADKQPTEPLRPVILMQLGASDGLVSRTFFGQVVARKTVDLAFQVGGQIVKFPATEGAEIKQGALIAELDPEPFELQLQQAKLNFDQANRAVERAKRLGSTVSAVTLEDAQTQLGLARVALRNAEKAARDARLIAPFDALISSRNTENFTTVGPGTPVVRLHDMAEIRIEIDVPEVLFQRVSKNAGATLKAKFPASEKSFSLQVREFNAEASAIGQTYRLTLGMPRPKDLNILPGSSATVTASVDGGIRPQIVPAAAVRIAPNGSTSVMVFVPGEGGKGTVKEVKVTVAPARDGAFAVSSGLKKGDEIVRAGAHLLSDGQAVRRFGGYGN